MVGVGVRRQPTPRPSPSLEGKTGDNPPLTPPNPPLAPPPPRRGGEKRE
ncbi:hypothetical protein [Okeania sp. SIO1I7]|nr:hypothetical protein [Okeania sp. SIO1I7]NET26059.1 hypothetical protein [Okeania sp. SIO1I7]